MAVHLDAGRTKISRIKYLELLLILHVREFLSIFSSEYTMKVGKDFLDIQLSEIEIYLSF